VELATYLKGQSLMQRSHWRCMSPAAVHSRNHIRTPCGTVSWSASAAAVGRLRSSGWHMATCDHVTCHMWPCEHVTHVTWMYQWRRFACIGPHAPKPPTQLLVMKSPTQSICPDVGRGMDPSLGVALCAVLGRGFSPSSGFTGTVCG
jgi:hypothetical protein